MVVLGSRLFVSPLVLVLSCVAALGSLRLGLGTCGGAGAVVPCGCPSGGRVRGASSGLSPSPLLGDLLGRAVRLG